MIKLNLNCNTTYLNGYDNVDTLGKFINEVDANYNITTIDRYVKNSSGEIIKDKHLNLLLPWDGYKDASIDEILAIDVIAKYTKEEAIFIMGEIKRVLKPNGKLIIDFPDIESLVHECVFTNPDMAMELVYSNKWGYTFLTFRDLLETDWLSITKETIVKRIYPTVGVVAIKS